MNSPSYHTRVLTVECDPGDIEDNNWVRGFSRVERLVVDDSHTFIPFSQFHQLAPSLKSLLVVSLSFPQSQIFALICSLPFLEDLALIGDSDPIEIGESDDTLALAPTSPTLTGTLDIFLSEGVAGVLRGLLDLPGGLRFRRVELSWCSELDLPQVVELVTACSGTLEYFDLACGIDDEDVLAPIDLSKAARLKDIVFRCGIGSGNCGWIITALETIMSTHREHPQILIHIPYAPDYVRDRGLIQQVEEAGSGMRWSDLDRLLVQLWESCSIRSMIVCPRSKIKTRGVEDWARYLLPEIASRGRVELVDEFHGP